MTDQDHNESDTERAPDETDVRSPGKRRVRRRLFFWGGAGLAAVAGLVATRAWAHGRVFGHRRFHAASAEELRERLGDHAEFALRMLDASDEQRSAVEPILDTAAPELFAQQQKARALRAEMTRALEREDAAELEALRQRAIGLADTSSKQWLGLVQDLYAVLDDTQREEVREYLARHRRRHHGFQL